jgi:hypothetical protein
MVVSHRQRRLDRLSARQARLQQAGLSPSMRALLRVSNTTQTTPDVLSTWGSGSPSPAPPRALPPSPAPHHPLLEASSCQAPGVLRGAPREYVVSAAGVPCSPIASPRRAHPLRRRRPPLKTSTSGASRTRRGRSHHHAAGSPGFERGTSSSFRGRRVIASAAEHGERTASCFSSVHHSTSTTHDATPGGAHGSETCSPLRPRCMSP